MGDVIDLQARTGRRQQPATAADTARRRLAAAAQAVGGRQQLAAILTRSLGWTVRTSTLAAWESDVTPPADVLLAAEEAADEATAYGQATRSGTAAQASPVASLARARLRAAGDHAASMESLRAQDLRVGGGHLYAAVVDYLATAVAPDLVALDGGDGRSIFTAAAGLTEMAGWAAHDAGDDHAARAHFDRALDLVAVGGDRQLCAHVHASLSHLAHHRAQPARGLVHVRRGLRALGRGPAVPELHGRLFAMQARAVAAQGDGPGAVALLLDAERALCAPGGGDRSPWISGFDIGSLAAEAARCMRDVGDLAEMRRQAELIVASRPQDRARSRAFGLLLLADAAVRQGHPDEACDLVRHVLASTQHLGSALVVRQLGELAGRLGTYASRDQVVSGTLEHLHEELRRRTWPATPGMEGS